jgi:catecholate siderophore receptor
MTSQNAGTAGRAGRAGGVRSLARDALKSAALKSSALIGASLLAVGGGAVGVGAAQAEDEATNGEESRDVVYVFGRAIALGEKYTAPLIDTPQSITVVPSELIAQQNLLNMREILSTLPGITFGAGEGGGGYGDSINLRGYSANNDITVDGVRDSAQYSRTDPFNLEQLQLVSGANSVYAGAGAVGGSINIVTKQPMGEDATTVSAGVGSDGYGRLTLDAERVLGDRVSARLNVMTHRNDVAGRDVETYERWGVAPSVLVELGPRTDLTLAFVHQEDDNVPQYGVPFALGPFNDGPLPGAPTHAYYGYSNFDSQEIALDTLTAILERDLGGAVALRNLTRWQRVDQLSRVSPPQGGWCVAPGINPWTGEACASPGVFMPQTSATSTGPRGTTRDNTNEILVNQTDLTAQFDTGMIAHTLVAGVVFSKESFERLSGNSLRGPNGEIPTLPAMDIADPDNVYTGPVSFIPNQRADSEVENRAIYVFDRLQLSDRFEINGGLRLERNDGSFTLYRISNPPNPVETPDPIGENEADLFSYRVGVVFKPTPTSTLYAAYGNSETPSQSSVNGSCDAATSCNVDPEEAVVTEIGGKWDAMSGQLSLTAALFRNERSNYRVDSNDPTEADEQLDGKARVDGLALGVTGALTDRWTVYGNYTWLDGEILQGVSDFCVANPAAPGCALGGNNNLIAGDVLANTPEHSASLWTTYELPQGVTLGYGATYQGEIAFNRGSPDVAQSFSESYWVQRAMAAYAIGENLVVQLNIDNLADETYFERIRNNTTSGWATPGAGRSAVLSLTWRR